MKIISLRAENVKRLKAVEITPNGDTVVISGRNDQGKTSVLDSIWLALGGGEAAKSTRKPIRKGEARASVTLNLGDIIVTRSWTSDDRSYLQVSTKDGAKYPAPQAVLDKIIGDLSFDPLGFTRLPEKEQARVLMGLVQLSVNPDAIDAKAKGLYETRTITTRGLKQLEAQLAGMQAPAADTPLVETPADSIAAEMRQANEQALAVQRAEQYISQATDAVLSARKRSDELARRLEELRRQAEATQKALDENEAAIKDEEQEIGEKKAALIAMPRPDLGVFQARMQQLDQHNRAVRNAQTYHSLAKRIDETRATVEGLTANIDELQQAKADAIKAAKYPIDGLGFDDSGVTFQGIPLTQCSASGQLRVSMAIAMALNPKLRVIRILDGSLLDQDNFRIIQEMAREQDFQVWCEVVDGTGKIGVYIEDGAIAAVNN